MFVGELGLAAIHALGVKTGRVERFVKPEHQTREWDEVKEFMIKLFEKAADRGIKIELPVDFACAKKPSKKIQAVKVESQNAASAL